MEGDPMGALSRATTVVLFFAVILSCLLATLGAVSADPVLDIVMGGQRRHFGRDELLKRPDIQRISVANDVAYGKPMDYVAIPLPSLLAGLNPPANSVIESLALDGFAAQIPADSCPGHHETEHP